MTRWAERACVLSHGNSQIRRVAHRGAGAVRVVGPLIGAHGKCSMALMGSLHKAGAEGLGGEGGETRVGGREVG